MHHGGDQKENVCSFVYILVFVNVNSAIFKHPNFIYRIQIEISIYLYLKK